MDRFIAVIPCFLLLVGACAGGDPSASHAADTSSATDTTQTPAQATHALLAGDVARAIGLLQGAGCLDAAVATSLSSVLAPGTEAALGAFVEALDGADVCAGGASLLRAASKAPLLLAFEADGVVFDGDGDGCYDSTLLLPGATVASHDADGDGCRDQLEHLPALVARLGLPGAVAEGLLVRAADVSLRMVPLPYWHEPWASPPGPGFDWPTFRAEAEPRLDELVAWASTEVSAGARETVLAFLENARPTVASFPTFAPPPFTSDGTVLDRDDTKADDPVGYVDQKWLCLYVYSDGLETDDAGPVETFFGHAFVGLSQGDDEWRRGLYLYGHGANSGPLPKVPDGGQVTGDGSAEKESWENTVQRSSQPSFLWLENAWVVGPGDVRNDGGAAWHYRICWKITGAEWDAVAAAMNSAVVNPPIFQLFQGPTAPGQNCVVWAGRIVALAGKRVPDGSKLGNGSPFALANSIHKLMSSGKLGGADRVEKFQGCGDGVVQTALGESCETPTKKCSVFAHAKGSTSATEYTGVCNLSCQCEVVDAELGAGTFVAQGCFYDWDCPKAAQLCWERHCQKPLPGADPNVGSCASRPSTGPCDDGDPCTSGDHCNGGVCVAGPSCGDGTRQPDCGEACDPPGSVCGGGVFYQNGTCTAQCTCRTPDLPKTGLGELEWKACVTDADCVDMTLPPCWSAICNPTSRNCEPSIAAWGAPCDDGDACTEGDSCKHLVDYAGYVECSGTLKTCNDGDGCTLDGCDPATGQCTHVQDPAQDADGDGLCDTKDNCPAHANPDQKDTDGDGKGDACECADSECMDGAPCLFPCNPATGKCDPKPDGTACEDGVQCTLKDSCASGACKPGAVSTNKGCCKENTDCNDGNPCTNDWCEKPVGQCVNENLGVLDAKPPCEDGDPCTIGDFCDVGVCKPGSVKSCEDDGKPCTSDACDSATGACHEPLPDGTPCDDGMSCTKGDACKAGVCQGVVGFCCATNLDCPASGDPCSSVECVGGICQAFESGCCTSAADCTGGTICQTADCVGARCVYSNVSACCLANSDCSTGDPCTVGVCDKTTATCKVSAVPDCCNLDADCADDDVCTVNTCVDHACQHTVPPDCAWACCVDMQCESLTLNQCTVTGGTIIGKSCLDAYCEVVPCCSSAGSCSLAAPHDCSPPSGWPMYLAGTCSPDLCPKAQGCCLPDGSCSNLAAPACAAAKGVVHGGECGVFLPEPCPQPDDLVCCAQGGAKAGKLAQRALAECVGEGGHPADAAQCEDACCHLGGTWAFTLAGECPGVIVELGACMVDCCKTDVDARFRKVAECAATGGVAAPWSECALVCCQLPSGVLADLSAFECAINGGKAIPEQACGPVCCEDSATATALLTPWPNCDGVPGKKIVAADRCDTVCCESPAGPLTTTRGSCELDGGVVLTEEACVEVCCRYGFGGPSWSVTDASVCSALGGKVRPGAECALACCLVQPNPAQHQVLRHGLCDEKGYPVVGGPSEPACEGLPVTCGLDADCWGLSTVLDAGPTGAGCTQSHCEPALGICVVTPAADGTACEDGDSCTLGDACDDTGVCVPGPVASCEDDTDPCTTSSCVPLVGQCALAAGDCCQTDADCADGNICTADACTFTLGPDNETFVKQCHNDAIEGCCIFNVECDDGDSCTEDGCVDNVCVNVRAEGCCMEEAECDDGIVCTYDTCDWSGAGPAGTPGAHGTCKNQLWEDCCTADTDCDDGNPCTANVCDPLLIVPVLGTCMYPWSRETCCKTAADCDDGKPCTWDACVPDLASKLWSCENLPIEDCTPCAEDADCDDGDACNGAETCVVGKCTPGQALHCETGAPCLSGACDPTTGCVLEPAEGECDDGDGCTMADYCAGGDCLPGQVVECDDAGPCMTAPGCDPGDGSCLPPAPVEDGSQCAGGVCQGGACKPAVTPCGQLGAVVDCGAQAVAVSLAVEGDVATLGFSTQGAAASGQATVYLSLPNKDPVYAAEVLTIGAASCGPMVPVQKTQGSGWITLKFAYGPNQTYAIKLYRDFSAGAAPLALTIDATCL